MAGLLPRQIENHDEYAHPSIKKIEAIIQNRKYAKERTNIANSRMQGNVRIQPKLRKSKMEVCELGLDDLRKERVQVTRQLQYLAHRDQSQSAETFGFLNSQSFADFLILLVRCSNNVFDDSFAYLKFEGLMHYSRIPMVRKMA